MKKSSKRDVIIILILLTISLAGYFIYQAVINNRNVAKALVIYDVDVVVVVDFELETVEKIIDQPGSPNYPIIDTENKTITLLGDHTKGGARQEVVIRYSFERKSMQIIKEESPNNICSDLGESTGMSLICLPNNVRIQFDTGQDIDNEI